MAYKDKQYNDNIKAAFLDDALCDLWQLRSADGKEYQDSARRRFVDPQEFEAHLQHISKELWPVEFRKAFAFFAGLEAANKMTWGATAALACIKDLAACYVPELGTAAPTTEKSDSAPQLGPGDVPPYMANLNITRDVEKAAIVFYNLRRVNFLGKDWTPAKNIEKNEIAYIVYQLAAILWNRSGGVDKLCKAWGLEYKNVKAGKSRLLNKTPQDVGTQYGGTLKSALAGAGLEDNAAAVLIAKHGYRLYKEIIEANNK